MRKGDIALIIIAVIFLVLWLIPKPQGGIVTISVNGDIYKEVSLNSDREIQVETEFGKNTVVIENGEVYISNTNCPNRLCQNDKISKGGESIVCLPNRLSVTISKNQKEEIDVII